MRSELDAGRRLVRLAACALAGLVTAGGVAGPAQAVLPQASGRSGACTSADQNAVTVVIDYQNLGGGIKQYCASGLAKGAVRMDALKAVGLSTTGTNHDGVGFVCRIDGRPSAKESIRIPGNDDYRENCVDTPPATAYWSYWWAEAAGSWVYSNKGVLSHRVVIGGYEAWSFSNDPGGGYGGTNPAPGVKPDEWAAPPASSTPKPTATKSTTPKPPATKPTSKPTATRSSTPKPTPTMVSTPTPTPTPSASGNAVASETPTVSATSATPSLPTPSGSPPSTGGTPSGSATPGEGTATETPTEAATGGPGAGLIAAGVLVVAAVAGGILAVRRRHPR